MQRVRQPDRGARLGRIVIRWLPLAAAVLLTACSNPEDRAQAYSTAAQEFYAKGDAKRAKVEAQNALQLAPKLVPARYLLAEIAEADGEIGQMFGHLEVVINEDPAHVPSRLKLAKYLVFAKDYPGARDLAGQLEKLAPEDPGYLFLTARLALVDNDVPRALAILDRVIARQPDNVEALLLKGLTVSFTDPQAALADLGAALPRLDQEQAKAVRQARIDILARLGDEAAVENELRGLIADYPEAGYSRDLASFLVARNRPDDAEAALRAAVVADPGNFDLKYALAQFLARVRNNPQLAEQTLKDFAAQSPDEPRLAVLLGTFYEASGRPAEAIVQYQAAAERGARTDTGYEARARIATMKFATGEVAAARADYDAILTDAPDNVRALAGRGELNLAEGRFDDAIADLRGALRKEPENEAALLALARAQRGRGEASLAQDAYRALLQVNPRRIDAATEFGVLLQAAGQLDEAEKLFRDAIAQQSNYVPAGSGLVEVLIARRELAGAEAEARRLVALDDALGIGQLQLGKVLQAQGDNSGAAAAFRAALARTPTSTLALRGLAGSLTLAGQLEAAGRAIEAFVAANPDDAEAHLLLAGNLVRRARYEPARAAAGRAMALQPTDARGYILLASTWPEAPAEREAALRKGIAAVPGALELTDLLGSDLVANGRVDDAIALYDAALKRDPAQRRLANSLAALLLDAKADDASHRRALELAQAFAGSRDPAELDTLGWAHYRLRDYPQATGFLERALAAEGDNPVIRYHLGMAYKAANNPAGARQELEKALAAGTAFPGAREAQQALAELRGAASAG